MEDEFFGRATAHHVGHLVEELGAGLRVLVLVGQHHRVAERAATRENGDLLHWVVAGHRRGDERVAAFVVGRNQALVLVHQAGLLLRTSHDAINGLVELGLADDVEIEACREECRFVEHVREVSAREPGRALRQRAEVDVGGEWLALRMHAEDVLTALHVGSLDTDLAVEPARAQERGVENVGAVGRGDEDHAATSVEAIHLDEELVERLLTFVVAATHPGAAVASDGVDLVDENDGGRVLLGLIEQVTDAGGTDADEHLDEVGAGDGEEGHAGLACDRASEEGLAGAGRAVEEYALGDLGAELGEAFGLLEEFLDLDELFDGLIGAGDVVERRLGGVLARELCPRLAERHRAARARVVHHPEDEEEGDDQDEERQPRVEEHLPEARRRVEGIPLLERAVGLALLDELQDLVDLISDPPGLGARAVLLRDLDGLLAVDQDHFRQLLIALEQLDGLARRHIGGAGDRAEQLPAQHEHDDDDENPRHRGFEELLQRTLQDGKIGNRSLPAGGNRPTS